MPFAAAAGSRTARFDQRLDCLSTRGQSQNFFSLTVSDALAGARLAPAPTSPNRTTVLFFQPPSPPHAASQHHPPQHRLRTESGRNCPEKCAKVCTFPRPTPPKEAKNVPKSGTFFRSFSLISSPFRPDRLSLDDPRRHGSSLAAPPPHHRQRYDKFAALCRNAAAASTETERPKIASLAICSIIHVGSWSGRLWGPVQQAY